MIQDPYAIKIDSDEPSLLGDLISLFGAGSGAITMKFISFMPK